jgi:hypothetical protein
VQPCPSRGSTHAIHCPGTDRMRPTVGLTTL